MRCDCCNRPLSDAESTAKFAESGNYVGMCSTCCKYLPKDLKIVTRKDLQKTEEDPYPDAIVEDDPPELLDPSDFFSEDE